MQMIHKCGLGKQKCDINHFQKVLLVLHQGNLYERSKDYLPFLSMVRMMYSLLWLTFGWRIDVCPVCDMLLPPSCHPATNQQHRGDCVFHVASLSGRFVTDMSQQIYTPYFTVNVSNIYFLFEDKSLQDFEMLYLLHMHMVQL